ncbi:hypothetical protein Tco_0230349 [Tanacetum coccineum]
MDSHDHLFVQCTYAEEVWKNVRVIGYLSQLKHNWDDTISAMSANHYNAIKSVVRRIITRLKSLRVKNSANVQKVANEWGIIFKHGIVDPGIMKTINSPWFGFQFISLELYLERA